MATPDLLHTFIADSGARVVFADAKSALELDLTALGERALVMLDGGGGFGWRSFEEWLSGVSAPMRPAAPVRTDEFNLIYSSGTTGSPKGIVQDHQLRALQIAAFEAFGLGPDAQTLITTALYTNYSLVALFASLGAGGAVHIMPRFREADALTALRSSSITHAFLVPAQITRLLAHEDFDASVAQGNAIVFSAGSPLSEPTKRELIARWPGTLVEIYGATEGGASTVLVASQHPDKLQSVGKPSGGCDIRIIGEDGCEAPLGATGEIVGRSAAMMRGYLHQAEANEAVIWQSPEGEIYLRSGDIGHFDADGFLYLSDRKKDMIISGGLNVYACDIEAVLAAHPDVSECAVVAAPSRRWGEAPVAFVVAANAVPSEMELMRWANGRLARHQQLRAVIYQSTLPRNDMGKVLKKALRARLVDADYS